MKHKDFSDLVQAQFEQTVSVLLSKGKEYARGDDRLHNFRKAARMRGCTLPEAIRGMYMKHFVSIDDIIDAYAERPMPVDSAILDEKIGDMINYLILLKASLLELGENHE